jgi:LmbE family N-acetylglucosaminyl deacetylase
VPLRLLGVFAHPLDGSLLSGGTFGRYAAAGVETMLVWAASSADRASCRRAAQAMGVQHLVLLDYEPGELAGLAPSCLMDVCADVLRSFRPAVVITLGLGADPVDPDHAAIHRAASGAFSGIRGAGGSDRPRRLYYGAMPRGHVFRLLPVLADAGISSSCATGLNLEASESTLTAVLNVGAFGEGKLAAIRALGNAASAHPAPALQPDQRRAAEAALAREFFRRAFPEPWVSGVLERDLLAGLYADPRSQAPEVDAAQAS